MIYFGDRFMDFSMWMGHLQKSVLFFCSLIPFIQISLFILCQDDLSVTESTVLELLIAIVLGLTCDFVPLLVLFKLN